MSDQSTQIDSSRDFTFGELYSCCCLPFLPQLACSIHATWCIKFSRSLINQGLCYCAPNGIFEGRQMKGIATLDSGCIFFFSHDHHRCLHPSIHSALGISPEGEERRLLAPSQVRLRRLQEILLFDNISEASTIGGYSCMRRSPLAERTPLPCVGRPKSQTPNAVILHPSSEKELALSSPRLWKRRSTCSKNQHGTSRSVKIGVHSPFGVSRRRSRPWRGCPDLRPD